MHNLFLFSKILNFSIDPRFDFTETPFCCNICKDCHAVCCCYNDCQITQFWISSNSHYFKKCYCIQISSKQCTVLFLLGRVIVGDWAKMTNCVKILMKYLQTAISVTDPSDYSVYQKTVEMVTTNTFWKNCLAVCNRSKQLTRNIQQHSTTMSTPSVANTTATSTDRPMCSSFIPFSSIAFLKRTLVHNVKAVITIFRLPANNTTWICMTMILKMT